MSYINKEAAIDLIESMVADKGVAFNPYKLAMALKDMESVEIPEAKDTDLISRQAAIELACWRCDKCERQDCEYKDSCKTMELLDALPSEDVKPPMLNNDCISRQAAIDAVEKAVFKGVAKSAIESLPPVEPVAESATTTDEVVDFNNMISVGGRIRNLPPVEPKPVCEDAISRQDAIEALDHIHIPTQAQREYAIEIFENIPQVEPKQSELHIDEPRGYTLKANKKAKACSERPKGEWVEYIDDMNGARYGRCTSCNKSTLNAVSYDLDGQRYIMDFCPKCGSYNGGENEA